MAPQYFDHFTRFSRAVLDIFFKKNEEVGLRALIQHIEIIGRMVCGLICVWL
jgi:hypothetical protein